MTVTCDVCSRARVGKPEARVEVPVSEHEPDVFLPGWARVEIVLSTRVVLPNQDDLAAAIANLPPIMGEYGAALVAQQMKPFRTVLHVCPACYETLGPAATVVALRLREREFVSGAPDAPPPPPLHLRPVE